MNRPCPMTLALDAYQAQVDREAELDAYLETRLEAYLEKHVDDLLWHLYLNDETLQGRVHDMARNILLAQLKDAANDPD